MNIKQHLLDSTESIANLLPAVDGYATCYELSLTQEAARAAAALPAQQGRTAATTRKIASNCST